jgi:hypothetical protein
LHNKPLGCGASVAFTAGPLKKLGLGCKRGKVAPVHAMKAYREKRGTAPLIWVVEIRIRNSNNIIKYCSDV